MDLTLENELRAATFAWLAEQSALHGDVLGGGLLKRGFDFRGHRVPLVVQQGIHKPKFVDGALTLRTSYDSPYGDHFDGDETLVYSYRGDDPNTWDNRAARFAYEHELPLVYLHAVAKDPPRYVAVWPVYVTASDPAALTFRLQAEGIAGGDLAKSLRVSTTHEATEVRELRRAYGTRLVRTRLHQATFRERVLSAYKNQCAMCRLKHTKLLDAAHITPDSDPSGEPLVTNGISLCRIHHGAFDVHYLSIDPTNYEVRVLPSLLDETDGPMLEHGLKKLEGSKLILPRKIAERPDPERLRVHWEQFHATG